MEYIDSEASSESFKRAPGRRYVNERRVDSICETVEGFESIQELYLLRSSGCREKMEEEGDDAEAEGDAEANNLLSSGLALAGVVTMMIDSIVLKISHVIATYLSYDHTRLDKRKECL